MHSNSDSDRPLWHELLAVAVPILLAELALGVREYLRREHKARLKARAAQDRRPPVNDA